MENEVINILESTGAILHGHFKLSSGLHSDTYIEKFKVLQYPHHIQSLCSILAERFRGDNVQLVVGPAIGGIIIAYEVAKNLNTRAYFLEREGGKLTLRRGFQIEPGERVLVVDDIATTGGSVREVVDAVRSHGGIPVGIGLLCDRSGGSVGQVLNLSYGNIKKEALATLKMATYTPEDCPLCQRGLPLTSRGSRELK
ncbi:MAG: orotate phosphoribosyltransferase [bacterium]